MSNYVISISREFGSGGRLIGKRLAARLGIPCYDRTLIQKTAEKSGLSPEFIARAEERLEALKAEAEAAASDYVKLQEVYEEQNRVEAELAQLYERWEEWSAQLEEARG